MAREQASVAPPAPSRDEEFSPHPVLRAAGREGALFSLRLFGDAADDATALVLGGGTSKRFAPIPPRAATLFEAFASVMANDGDGSLTLGFPLVTFVQQGAKRAAPLFSRGDARTRWLVGDAPWKLPTGARDGAALPVPDALVVELGPNETFTLHGGVWHYLFGLDGAALSAVAMAGRAGLGALVRAATRALEAGADEAVERDEDPSAPEPREGDPAGGGPADTSSEANAATDGPRVTREELAALLEAAQRRASPSRALRCHPHGLVMMTPRGDPTSALRADLQALASEPLPPRGPLAVYLGARGAPLGPEAVVARGSLAPTPSQLEAARAFEATTDLIAVCGPPGCGKTALMHQVTAQAVVSCALGKLWAGPPPRATAWPLVVASTNNAAVDQALAPFVGGRTGGGLALGLRLGNRRAMAEVTVAALTAAIEELERPGAATLKDARAAFEERAAPVRAFLENRAAIKEAAAKKASLERRAVAIREALANMPVEPPATLDAEALDDAERVLREHAEAASRLIPLHLEGPKASVGRAADKWLRACELRAPRVTPVLEALSLPVPFGPLDVQDPHGDITRQRASIERSVSALDRVRLALQAPALRHELDAITAEQAAASHATDDPTLDPALYQAALELRDAWARTHRAALLPRLLAARDAARGEVAEGRGKPLSFALRELAPLFPLAGCTLLSMRGAFPLDREIIDRLVIDEAAQCAPIYAAPAMARARRVMLTGDVAQLPPVYTLDPRVDERLARGLDGDAIAAFRMGSDAISSAQAVAESRARTRLSLVEHFRSQPPIVALASQWSGYTLDVRTEPRSLGDVAPRLSSAVLVIPTAGVGARAPEGVVNDAEASRSVELVTELIADGVAPSDIAVLTPFVGQSLRIERALDRRGMIEGGGVLVSTVHRLQGGERRVVVFSVTATDRRHLRWLGERPHLLHVATSRARDHLVVLVDPRAVADEASLAPLRPFIPDRA